ncbi:hypothetical protein EAF00_010971 [Botryotinia globosa]|nr:hypothetical protein EAF00_010971 [Botryotinia globosa]
MSTPQICRLRRSALPFTRKNFFTSSPLPRHAPSKSKQIRIPQRFFSSAHPLTSTPKPPTPISATSFSSSRSRLQNRMQTLQSRLPKFLHPYTAPLLNAPKTYIISFLILHEITAIVPILLLASGFHYSGWLPSDLIPEERVDKAKGMFERWFGRRGWFGYTAGSRLDGVDERNEGENVERGEGMIRKMGGDSNTSGKRIVLEVATAYVITKALLPVRIVVSVWGAPWFAGVMGRIGRLARGGRT